MENEQKRPGNIGIALMQIGCGLTAISFGLCGLVAFAIIFIGGCK